MKTDGRVIVYGQDKEVYDWLCPIIGGAFYGYRAIGMKRNGEYIAACLYDRFSPRECQIHIASAVGTKWATRDAIHAAFEYPFHRLNLSRITAETPVGNIAARKFNEHIGFVQEGIKRGAADDGSDAIIFGMLRSECRWLRTPT